MSSQRRSRIALRAIAASVAAAATPAVGIACWITVSLTVLGLRYPGPYVTSDNVVNVERGVFSALELFILAYAIAFGIAAAHMLVLGVPAFLVGLRLRSIHWWSCIVVGFLIGMGPFVLSARLMDVQLTRSQLYASILFWGGCGAAGGLVFWLVWSDALRRLPLSKLWATQGVGSGRPSWLRLGVAGPDSRNRVDAFKLCVSFLLSVAFPVVMIGSLLEYFGLRQTGTSTGDSIGAAVTGSMVALGLASVFALLLALPALWIGLRLRVIHWWTCIPAGLAIGLIPTLYEYWSWHFEFGSYQAGYLQSLITTGLQGASGGLLFRLLWRYWITREPGAPIAADQA